MEAQLEAYYKEAKLRMEKAIEHLKIEYSKIRGARASVGMLEDIKVEVYGSVMPIKHLSTLTLQDSKTVIIQVWDKTTIGLIKKAIEKSELGLNPQVEGNIIRIIFPELTQERRLQLDKLIKKKAEESKIAIRNIRRDINEHIKELKKNKKISEDQEHRALEKIQKITEDYINKIEEILKQKEKEILE